MERLTESEKILIRILKCMGLDEDETVGTVLSLDTEEKQDMLVEFIGTHREATSQEILREVIRILKVTDEETADLEPIE